MHLTYLSKIKKLITDDIGNPPWSYYHLFTLDEKEYPKYLKKIFKYRTGEILNLKNPKTFNEKSNGLNFTVLLI